MPMSSRSVRSSISPRADRAPQESDRARCSFLFVRLLPVRCHLTPLLHHDKAAWHARSYGPIRAHSMATNDGSSDASRPAKTLLPACDIVFDCDREDAVRVVECLRSFRGGAADGFQPYQYGRAGLREACCAIT